MKALEIKLIDLKIGDVLDMPETRYSASIVGTLIKTTKSNITLHSSVTFLDGEIFEYDCVIRKGTSQFHAERPVFVMRNNINYRLV